jgi:hypothetical protein
LLISAMCSLASKARACLSSNAAQRDSARNQHILSHRHRSPLRLGRGRDLERASNSQDLGSCASPRQRQSCPSAAARSLSTCRVSDRSLPAGCMSRVPAQQIGKAELMEQTDAALLRSELLLEEMLNSGLFDADVHVSQASPEAEVSAADNQYGNGFVDSPADWAASKTVEVPVTMLQTLAKMWDELQSHREAEKHSELSVASTRCPTSSRLRLTPTKIWRAVRLLAASLCLRCQAINSPAACQCAHGQALSPHRCWRRGSSSRNCGSSFATRFAKRAFLNQSKFARQHESMCLLIQDLCELRGDLSGSLLPRRVSVVAS